MKGKLFFLHIMAVIVFGVSHFAYAENQTKQTGFAISNVTQDQRYKVDLTCDEPLSVGKFQSCQLAVFVLDEQATEKDSESKSKITQNNILKNATILLDGGMPAHHHGLPTSPVVNWSEDTQAYQIKGLKFSMPGEWELRLLISDTAKSKVQDKLVFKFSL